MHHIIQEYSTPFKTVPFDKIENSDFIPALKEAIKISQERIKQIKNNSHQANFQNTIEALEFADSEIELISNIFFNLHSAESSPELQEIANTFSPLLTEFANDISLDKDLFAKIKSVYDNKKNLNLNSEELMLINNQYKDFVRNGALLNEEDQAKVRKISSRLSQLSLFYSNNVLKDINSFKLIIDDQKDLAGIPQDAIQAAASLAKKENKDGQWIFTLQQPSYIPFVTYCKNRELRKNLVVARGQVASHGNETDNSKNILEIITLKNDLAKILGYDNHAQFVLEERMAQNPETVTNFLQRIKRQAFNKAKQDIEELSHLAKELDGIDQIMPCDNAYYTEKLKSKQLDFSTQDIKPYLKFENVVDGAFAVANKLYGLNFVETKDITKYHEDVITYIVEDQSKKMVGIFYVDLFPREGKQSGAWMTHFKIQHKQNDLNHIPHVSIVCNFTRPTKENPSLLTLNETLTLFHEFGHSLHGLLSDCKYKSLASPNVFWDFVECPSQIMENWVYQKECLQLFAKHYQTGEIIPDELIEKIQKMLKFQEGKNTIRQINLSTLDLAWHTVDPTTVKSVSSFEQEVTKDTQLFPTVEEVSISTSFSHIFAGGYDAGYYSYKWAEVIEADIFASFKEQGLFNFSMATKFKENILSKGGSIHPMTLFKNLMGREPDPKYLLERAGIL